MSAIANRKNILVSISLLIVISVACNTKNHIDKYEVDVDSLKILPDGFYAYRRGRIYSAYVHMKKYRIWYNLNDKGNVGSIFKIEDFDNIDAKENQTIIKYQIDTLYDKTITQRFIDLSRKFKFGHIKIDKKNKISFSYIDGLPEQYVKTFNDSTRKIYMKHSDFKLLKNGWFENSEKNWLSIIPHE